MGKNVQNDDIDLDARIAAQLRDPDSALFRALKEGEAALQARRDAAAAERAETRRQAAFWVVREALVDCPERLTITQRCVIRDALDYAHLHACPSECRHCAEMRGLGRQQHRIAPGNISPDQDIPFYSGRAKGSQI